MVGSPSGKKKHIVRRIAKLSFKIVIIILLVILVLIFLIQTSFVQDFARRKIKTYLQARLNTRVEIGGLYISFPKQIVIEQLYIEDRHKDTLLNAGKIAVDISMFKLLRNTLELNAIELENTTVKIKRQLPDSSFNYEFILKAFAGNQEPKPKASDTSNMKFAIGKIRLHRIAATYIDDATGNDAYLSLADFETHIETFDPGHMIFSVPDLSLSGVKSRIRQYKPLLLLQQFADTVAAQHTQQNPVYLKLGDFSFTDIGADYKNEMTASHANIRLGSLQASVKKIDLDKLYVGLDQIKLDSSSILLSIGKMVAAKQKAGDQQGQKQQSGWLSLDLGRLDLNNNDIRYDNANAAPQKEGIDYNHLQVKGLSASITSISIQPNEYKASVGSFSFLEKSGFELKKLSAGIDYNARQASLNKLVLVTGNSTIKTNSQLNYISIDDLDKHPGNLKLALDFEQGDIGMRDLFLLMPALKKQLKAGEAQKLSIAGKINGELKNLKIQRLMLSGLDDTRLAVSGQISGLPDFKKAVFDLDIKNLNSSRKDILALVPASTLPSSIRIPSSLSLNGNFHGSAGHFKTLLHLRTSNGGLDLDGSLANASKTFDFTISSNGLNLGYILKQDSLLGRFTLTGDLKGKGFDYKTMQAVLHAHIQEAGINGYLYHDLRTSDTLVNGEANFHLSANDASLKMNLDAEANVQTSYPALNLFMQLDTADLHALHLSGDSIGLKWAIQANFPSTDPDSLAGNLKWYDLVIFRNGTTLKTDSVLLTAAHTDSLEQIALRSEIADLDWKGHYKLTQVPQAVSALVDQYYKLKNFKKKEISPQDWQLRATLKPEPLLYQLMPQLKGSDSLSVWIQFNSDRKDLKLDIENKKVQYGDFPVNGLAVSLITRDTSLDYRIAIASAGNQNIRLNQTHLQGYLANNRFFTSLVFKDRQTKTNYQLSGLLEQINNGLVFRFNADSLLLNYDKWDLSRDNFIKYDSTGLVVHNLKLSKQQQFFIINSESASAAAPIDVRFEQFRIGTLSRFAGQDSLLADGLIDGSVQLKNALKSPVFTSDVQIRDLSYKGDTVGNLTVKVNNEAQNEYRADITLAGHENDLKIKGAYFTGNGNMDLLLNIGKLNLETIKPFAGASLNEIHGLLKGNLKLSGAPARPVLNGVVHFEQAYVVPVISGEKLRLPQDPIAFDGDGLNFSSYTLLDSAGNKAVLDGNVFTSDYRNYKFDLSLNASNFRLVNSQRSVNKLFFGKLNLDAALDVSGTLESPKINADLRINKATDFTLILPSSDPELVDREGVVIFTDKDQYIDTARFQGMLDSVSRNLELKGMDVAATIETDSSALFTMIIDERNGDALSVKGRSDLVAGIDKSGKTTLTGSYELENGSYNLSLSLLKRKFIIQKGSIITWTGDPTRANIDITAIYQVNTAPIDLVQQQLAGRSASDITRFKTRLPFQVSLKMTGELLKPVISFEIDLPQDLLSQWPDVDAKLQQMKSDESEVNKQVFALLLLNRFVSENPFENAAGGTDAGTLAKQSASRILSDQLNQLAGSLIKGVDLNFDLNSATDYSTGQAVSQTNLNVGVSKNLFSDRIRVTVGSNFALEGTNPNQNASNIAGDVNVDYRLSKDGRYMLRAYRKDQYESIVEGQVVETGLSFILTFDYDKFRELFENQKEAKKQVKESKKKSSTNTESNP